MRLGSIILFVVAFLFAGLATLFVRSDFRQRTKGERDANGGCCRSRPQGG